MTETEALNEISEPQDCPKCRSKLPPRFSTGRVVCSKCGWTNQPKNNSAQGSNSKKQEILVSKPAFLGSLGELIKTINEKRNLMSAGTSSPPRRVRVWLGIGIFFLPQIFSWFTLRKGYSNLVRFAAFGWLGFVFLTSSSYKGQSQVSTETQNTPTASDGLISTETQNTPTASNGRRLCVENFNAAMGSFATANLGSSVEELNIHVYGSLSESDVERIADSFSRGIFQTCRIKTIRFTFDGYSGQIIKHR